MSDGQFYRQEILKMVSAIHDAETLNSIYSFTKVFADDEKGAQHEYQRDNAQEQP